MFDKLNIFVESEPELRDSSYKPRQDKNSNDLFRKKSYGVMSDDYPPIQFTDRNASIGTESRVYPHHLDDFQREPPRSSSSQRSRRPRNKADSTAIAVQLEGIN